METFSAAPHSDLLALVVQVAVLLVAARAFGWVSQRLGQPTVVGEILADVILGPSLLSGLIPESGSSRPGWSTSPGTHRVRSSSSTRKTEAIGGSGASSWGSLLAG